MTYKRRRKLNLIKRYGSKCYICGDPFPIEQLTLDHYIPKAIKRGIPNNTRLACKTCNNMKHSLTMPKLLLQVQKISKYQYKSQPKVSFIRQFIARLFKWRGSTKSESKSKTAVSIPSAA